MFQIINPPLEYSTISSPLLDPLAIPTVIHIEESPNKESQVDGRESGYSSGGIPILLQRFIAARHSDRLRATWHLGSLPQAAKSGLLGQLIRVSQCLLYRHAPMPLVLPLINGKQQTVSTANSKLFMA